MNDATQIEEPTQDAGLDDQMTARIMTAVEAGDSQALSDCLDQLHPADIADLLEQISEDEREKLLSLWTGDSVGDVLSELSEGLREGVLDRLAPETLSQAVRDLDTDDVVDLVEDLDPERQDAIIEALNAGDRIAVRQALAYPEESAGRLMQREVVTAPEHWTVGEMIDFLRNAGDLPEQFYHVTLVDPAMRPVADVSLGRLLAARRTVALRAITEDSFRTIRVDASDEDVAYVFNQYHLISAPVVDEAGRLVGVITIDDAMIVLSDEAEEDLLRLAGVGEGSLFDKPIDTVKARLPWLVVNLLTAILASVVIARFEDAITQIVALAVLMPIVASMGGNAGTQSLTIAVRALATRDLTGSNVWRVIRREAVVGLINGLVFAVIMAGVGMAWFGSPLLGAVIGTAMVINLFVAGLAGILVPLCLDKLNLDPALASGTFVTTVTDVVGFMSFLGLATLVLL
ncbi:MAG: magnesium transporter [Qingshengfaniella sp.]